MAGCEPGTCYVQDFHVQECCSLLRRCPISAFPKNRRLHLRYCARRNGRFSRANATTTRGVPCSPTDPAMQPTAKGLRPRNGDTAYSRTPQEFKVWHNSLADSAERLLEVGGPLGTPECMLPGDIAEPVPKWLSLSHDQMKSSARRPATGSFPREARRPTRSVSDGRAGKLVFPAARLWGERAPGTSRRPTT
jgi:hypothetical protein